MRLPRLRVRNLLILEGVISISVSSYLATSTYVFHAHLLGQTIPVAQRSFSFASLFAGLFMVILGTLSTSRTRAVWYTSFLLLSLEVVIFLISLGRKSHVSLLGIILAAFTMFLLIRRRKDYVEPSQLLTDPRLAVSLIIVAFTAAYGVGGSLLLGQDFRPPITSIGTAIYYAGETVTTLGFGDILPVTLSARLFTVSLSVMGVAVFFGALTLLITPVIEKRIGGVTMTMERLGVRSLRDYTLICGYSPLVQAFISAQRSRGKNVVVIDDEVGQEALASLGVLTVKGEPDDEKALSVFQLGNSECIVVGTSDDSRNMLICAALSQVVDGETRKKVSVIVNSPRNRNKFAPFGFRIIDLSELVSRSLG
ncbi:hypothetical protein GCM10007108_05590 [Thermogymnomonas acidicola]|uniref:Voltage-gated potassium channel n=1 Tax=Thermogymnomonas acidicola TaxID=399579 RepID=A0AA37BQH4_9ARCH|nr:NAD-binding protein [Thermogymnomonas acidicola]GGM70384.1 hypothetical protein GCM10007108_05590 [Thermogymnomonas acidicola]